jgi:hypothetical protein
LQVALRWFPQYAWIAIDGHVVKEHAGDLSLAGGVDFSTAVLDSFLKRGQTQKLEITMYGAAPVDFDQHVQLLAYSLSGLLGDWQFRPWTDPTEAGPVSAGDPVWWETEFEKPTAPGPFFLVTQGLWKGQAYLNGKALGRYWEIGPQHSLYVPQPWLAAQNRLVILDEKGLSPEQVYLMRDIRVPSESVWI